MNEKLIEYLSDFWYNKYVPLRRGYVKLLGERKDLLKQIDDLKIKLIKVQKKGLEAEIVEVFDRSNQTREELILENTRLREMNARLQKKYNHLAQINSQLRK